MLIVVGIMLCGVALGYFLRGRDLKIVSKLIMIAIYLLLFLLGVSVGGNREIINNLTSIGVDGVIIALASLLGSSFAALYVYNKYFKTQNNER